MPESRQPLQVFCGLGQVAAAQGDGGEDRHRERDAAKRPPAFTRLEADSASAAASSSRPAARAIRARSTSVIPSGLGPLTSKASVIAVASSSRADLDEDGGQEHVRAEMRGLVGPVRRLADGLSG